MHSFFLQGFGLVGSILEMSPTYAAILNKQRQTRTQVTAYNINNIQQMNTTLQVIDCDKQNNA